MHDDTHQIEHRNMPLTDAVSFVARNFDTYLRDLREPAPPPASSYYPSPPASSYGHPAPPPRHDYDRGGPYRDSYGSSSYGGSSTAAAGYGYPEPRPAVASREPLPSAYYTDDRRRDEERLGVSGPPPRDEVVEKTYSSEVLSSMIEKLKREPGKPSLLLKIFYSQELIIIINNLLLTINN